MGRAHSHRFCRQGCLFVSTVPRLRGRFCTGRCVNSPLYSSWPSPSSHISAGWSPGQRSAVPGGGGDSSKPGRTSCNKPLLGTGRSQGLHGTLLGACRHSRGPCTLLGVQTKGGSSVHTRHPHSHHKLLH